MDAVARLFQAIENGDAIALMELLSGDPALAGARRSDGTSAVLFACYNFQKDALRALLRAGPELSVFDAAAVGDMKRLRQLITEDPELTYAWSPDGWTPLHLACYFGHEEPVRALVERGADVRAVSRNTMADEPLHAAAASRNEAIARLLLAYGAHPDAPQNGGWTALHAAARQGNRALVNVLLDAGADPAVRNDAGETAADIARAANHSELARMIERGGPVTR